jgi:hypothetical protein
MRPGACSISGMSFARRRCSRGSWTPPTCLGWPGTACWRSSRRSARVTTLTTSGVRSSAGRRGTRRAITSRRARAGESHPAAGRGPGAKALGLESGQVLDRKPYDLLFGERKAPDGTPLGRPPDSGRKAADIYDKLLAAEPHATAERKRELRLEATRKARQSRLFFDLGRAPGSPIRAAGRRRTPLAAGRGRVVAGLVSQLPGARAHAEGGPDPVLPGQAAAMGDRLLRAPRQPARPPTTARPQHRHPRPDSSRARMTGCQEVPAPSGVQHADASPRLAAHGRRTFRNSRTCPAITSAQASSLGSWTS